VVSAVQAGGAKIYTYARANFIAVIYSEQVRGAHKLELSIVFSYAKIAYFLLFSRTCSFGKQMLKSNCQQECVFSREVPVHWRVEEDVLSLALGELQ
jgi:hypothetical protein